MKTSTGFIVALLISASTAVSAGISVGAAPSGDPTKVAAKIIKYNFPSCKHVSGAVRSPDGSIRASCDGVKYLVFTVFNPKEGKAMEIAMNCTAAKSLANIDC